MDCHDKTTVDICSEPECLASSVVLKKRKDLTTPHTPNHSVLKVHRILFSRDTGRAEKNAKDALGVARGVLSDLKAQKEPMPQCAHCKKTVSQPCWYCVDCTSKFRNRALSKSPPPLTLPSQRRDSSATIASTNVSPSMKFIPRSTLSSESSRKLSKLSPQQRNDYEPSRDNLSPSKRRWKNSFQSSCGTAQKALQTRRSQNAWSRSRKIQNPTTEKSTTKKLSQPPTPTTTRLHIW